MSSSDFNSSSIKSHSDPDSSIDLIESSFYDPSPSKPRANADNYSILASRSPLANSTVFPQESANSTVSPQEFNKTVDDSDDEIVAVKPRRKRDFLDSDDDTEASNDSHKESFHEYRTSVVSSNSEDEIAESNDGGNSDEIVVPDSDEETTNHHSQRNESKNDLSAYRNPTHSESEESGSTLHSIYSPSGESKYESDVDSSAEVEEQPVRDQTEIPCTRPEYNKQVEKIKQLQDVMFKTKLTLSRVKLANLPDNGEQLKKKFEDVKLEFQSAQEKLRLMVVSEEDGASSDDAKVKNKNWEDIRAGIAIVQPKTFGVKGLQNFKQESALTAECLENIHGSLKVLPGENQMAENPAELKVELMEHQKKALAWLLHRETQKPRGGILADDMGLGKTLSMISLILAADKRKENDEDDEATEENIRKYNGNTLIICPASLLNQWSGEIDSKVKRGRLSYNIHHGSKRENKRKKLARFDVVISTYQTIASEHKNDGPVFGIRWERVILDEAHQIRNYKALISISCCNLSAKSRWALTGTPVQNKEMDMYALLKFLRCSPFDDLIVWRRWISDKTSGGGERLHAIISSLMLRRTKAELMDSGKLDSLPAKKWELITVTLEPDELSVYQKVLLFSQALFAEYLHQRAEKNQEYIATRDIANKDPNSDYNKMRKKLLKMNKQKEISGHEILVLLLRLRQICCHPFLITAMLENGEDLGELDDVNSKEMNLLDQLKNLNLDDNDVDDLVEKPVESVGLSTAAKGILNPNHPVFDQNRMSSKIKSVMKVVDEILKTDDKIVIVSQWVGYLNLIAVHLKNNDVKYLELNGSIPTDKRYNIIDCINNPKSSYKILLLSMTAGGVGLNLAGANHLLLLDLHWNPQIENQAQDRIYRMGQKKRVNVYKFMAGETIEESIKELQEKKLEIADSVLTGSKMVSANKLSLQDLKQLFNM